MPRHGQLASEEEVNDAAWAGTRGAMIGAARWGTIFGAMGLAGYFFSPVYRNLTFQFKVYLQMSGMTIGSIVEADRRMREHEVKMRRIRKVRRDAEVWSRYEMEYERQSTRGEKDGNSSTKGGGVVRNEVK